MRVTYNRELKVKDLLDALDIETFIPMQYRIIGVTGGSRERRLVPVIHNLIFVHSTQQVLTELKKERGESLPIRYMTRPRIDRGGHEIIRVPEKQMEDFIRVASAQMDDVLFLEEGDYLSQIGRRVRITKGYFAGVEGIIKRIKRNRRVVVSIEGVAAVATTYIPVDSLIPIE